MSKRPENRMVTQHPFTLAEQRLCLSPIAVLKKHFAKWKWSEVVSSYRYFSAIPGIRGRLGKEAR